MSDRLTRAALTWAERGWHVFPCAPGGKPPAIPDADWHDLATTSPRQIRDWWAMRPYNIGIDCGLSGLVVVDLDIPGHGRRVPGEIPDRRTGLDTLIRLCGEQGRPVPNPTFTAATPSGGMHLYYSAADIPVGSSKERLGPLIDVRATGGYVIAPGSYRDGGYYTVLNPGPLEPLPSWLAQLHGKPQPPPASVHLTLAAGSRNGSVRQGRTGRRGYERSHRPRLPRQRPEPLGVLPGATGRRRTPSRIRRHPGTIRGSGELRATRTGDQPGDPARADRRRALSPASARPHSPG
jgi:hypothetical protein